MTISTAGRSASGTSGNALPGSRSSSVSEEELAQAEEAAEAEARKYDSAGSSFAALKERSARRIAERDKPRASSEGDVDTSNLSRKERRRRIKAAKGLDGSFEDFPHLDALRPKEKYVFHSDYFWIDNRCCSILSFFHDDAAMDDFGAFWGINRIPSGLDDRVTTVVLEQIRREGEKWVKDHMKTSEKLDKLDEGEQDSGGSTRETRRRQRKISSDMDVVTDELQNGASYLGVQMRLLVKAPSLEVLDDSIEKIRSLYIDRFGTLKVAPYHGEQRQELTNLFSPNQATRGKGFHFTSTEFAGSYSLVTNGISDSTGEYVGYMVGDVNNSAVIFDVDDYDHHVVVADPSLNNELGRSYVSDMWGSKISQAAMLNNKRVVHIVLSGADMDRLGPRLDGITARLDMSSGDINMFEMFGKREDELAIFPAHLQKIVLMAEQAYSTNDAERAVVRGSLTETLTQFYVDKDMWALNAKYNRERLRVVGIPHTHVPRLQDIVTYFETKYKAMAKSEARDNEMLHAYNVLRLVFRDLLDNNGDLFNTHTNSEIDNATSAQRVLYDFSRLLKRGEGVAMAQLVNVVGFAVDSLSEGDTVVVHGAERIDDSVKEYISTQFEHLYRRGGRVAYIYSDVKKMIQDQEFNSFDESDWTMLGPMSDAVVELYQKTLHQEIPPDLAKLVTTKGSNLNYLRRGHSNVVFYRDLPLGINPERAKRREELMAKADRIRGSSQPQAAVDSSVERSSLQDLYSAEKQRQQNEARKPRMARRRRGPGAPRETAPAPARARMTRKP